MPKSEKILCASEWKRQNSRFSNFSQQLRKFGDLIKVIADKGYQGIAKIHQLSETPIQKKKGKKLTKQQKKYQRQLRN